MSSSEPSHGFRLRAVLLAELVALPLTLLAALPVAGLGSGSDYVLLVALAIVGIIVGFAVWRFGWPLRIARWMMMGAGIGVMCSIAVPILDSLIEFITRPWMRPTLENVVDYILTGGIMSPLYLGLGAAAAGIAWGLVRLLAWIEDSVRPSSDTHEHQ